MLQPANFQTARTVLVLSLMISRTLDEVPERGGELPLSTAVKTHGELRPLPQ